MIVNLTLARFGIDSPACAVDLETGTVSGPGAPALLALARMADGQAAFPHNVTLPAPDPLRRPESLALLLASCGYPVPAALASYPIPEPEPMPDGAVS